MGDFGFQWHLTDRCNARCSHCYQSRHDDAAERPVEHLFRMADSIVSELPAHRIAVNLTGGEPFLYPAFFELVRYLEGFEAVEELNVITNGTIASERVLDRLAAIKTSGTIKVSLESARAEINDAIRGEGSHRRVTANLPLFVATGRPVILMATLSRRTAAGLVELVEWAGSQGMKGVIFERFVPQGRGLAERRQALDGASWARVVETVADLAGVGDEDARELALFEAFWFVFEAGKISELRGARCNLGRHSMALMPDGTVYPCRRLPIAVGRLPEDPFSKVLDALDAWSPLRLREQLRGRRCRTCDVEGCAGCRAMALALTGDVLGDDPLCPIALDPEGTTRGIAGS